MVTKIQNTTIEETLSQILEHVILSDLVRPSDLEDIGVRFDLYGAMSQFGPVSTSELARHTGMLERTVTVWMGAQLAREAIAYEVHNGLYSLWSTWPPLR